MSIWHILFLISPPLTARVYGTGAKKEEASLFLGCVKIIKLLILK